MVARQLVVLNKEIRFFPQSYPFFLIFFSDNAAASTSSLLLTELGKPYMDEKPQKSSF